jgi:hypothetical protein
MEDLNTQFFMLTNNLFIVDKEINSDKNLASKGGE